MTFLNIYSAKKVIDHKIPSWMDFIKMFSISKWLLKSVICSLWKFILEKRYLHIFECHHLLLFCWVYNEPPQVYYIISGGRTHQNTKGWIVSEKDREIHICTSVRDEYKL